MKKFLTVLLALSVVFTYSFGTVFATVNDEYDKIDQAKAQLLSALDLEYQKTINSLEASTPVTSPAGTTIALDKEALAVAAKAYRDDLAADLDKAARTVKAEVASLDNKNIANYVANTTLAAVTKDITDAEIKDMITSTTSMKYTSVAAREQFAIDKAEALKEVAAIYISDYDGASREIATETSKGAANADKITSSYYELAAAEKARLTAEITKVTVDAEATFAEVAVALGDIKTAMSSPKDGTTSLIEAKPATTTDEKIFKDHKIFVDGDMNVVVKLLTTEQVANKELLDNASKNSAKSALTSLSDKLYAKNVDLKVNNKVNDAGYAHAEDQRAAIVTAYTFLIEQDGADYTSITTALNDWNVNDTWSTASAISYAAVNAAAIEDLEAYAAKYKAEKNADGFVIRDAKAVEDVVKAAKVSAFGVLNVEYDTTLDKTAIKDSCKAVNSELDFVKASLKAQIEENRADVLDLYYAQEQAAAGAEIDKLLAKIEAATLKSDAEKVVVGKGNANVNAIKAKIPTTVKKKNVVDGEITSAVNTEKGSALKAYADYLNSGKTDANDRISLDDVNWVTFYAEKGARTAQGVKDLLADAKAKIDTLKTGTQLDAEKVAVETLVAALPKTGITVANKEAVKAAFDANTAYEDNFENGMTSAKTIYNKAVLTAAIAAVQADEKASLEAEIKKLPAKATATLADKAAIKAVSDKVDAYNDACDDSDNMYLSSNKISSTDLTGLLDKMQELDKAAVEAAINALPLNITAADKAAVDAARALADAYIAEYTDLAAGTDASGQIDNLDELEAAEDKLVELGVDDVDVKSLSGIKATTKKVGKKVRVYFKNIPQEIKDLGDSAYIQVWKSKNAVKYNFSKKVAVTAKSTLISKTYNGKNYVKYRVVVVNADGTKSFSPWSTVGCRIIKK